MHVCLRVCMCVCECDDACVCVCMCVGGYPVVLCCRIGNPVGWGLGTFNSTNEPGCATGESHCVDCVTTPNLLSLEMV